MMQYRFYGIKDNLVENAHKKREVVPTSVRTYIPELFTFERGPLTRGRQPETYMVVFISKNNRSIWENLKMNMLRIYPNI